MVLLLVRRVDWGALVRDATPRAGGRAAGDRCDLDQVFVVLWFSQRLRVAQQDRVASPVLVERLFDRDPAVCTEVDAELHAGPPPGAPLAGPAVRAGQA